MKQQTLLQPNTSYQFRIWANNEVGSGEIKLTNARTKPPTEEKGESNKRRVPSLFMTLILLIYSFKLPDLIMRILEDAKEFDTRIWILAVAIGKCEKSISSSTFSVIPHLSERVTLCV
jgi:hypothetical protein